MYFPVSERKIRHNLDSSAGSCDSGLYGCAGVLNMHYIEKVWRNLENWTAVIVQYGFIVKRYVKYQGDKKYRTLQEQSIKAVRLDVLGACKSAERLYISCGFWFVEVKEMYYEDTG